MLALLVQALGSRTEDKLDARNGLRATIVDQDARATQAQLHHVRKGIASGALHAGGAEPHISLCSSSLSAAASAYQETLGREPPKGCTPADRFQRNPPLSLLQDAAAGAEFIVVPRLSNGCSGVSAKDGFARELKKANPTPPPKQLTSIVNAAVKLKRLAGGAEVGLAAAVTLTGDDEEISLPDGTQAFRLTCKPLQEPISACLDCLRPVTSTVEKLSSVSVDFLGMNGVCMKGATVTKPTVLLTFEDPTGKIAASTALVVVGTKSGAAPIRYDVKVAGSVGGKPSVRKDEEEAPIGMRVKATRQVAEGSFGGELDCTIFSTDVRKSISLWPDGTPLWRALCSDGKEITLTIGLPDEWRLRGKPILFTRQARMLPAGGASASSGAELVGCITRKWFEPAPGKATRPYLGIVDSYDPSDEFPWEVRYLPYEGESADTEQLAWEAEPG